MDTYPFDFEYRAPAIHYGHGRVADLSAVLADHNCERALVVCGSNVGSNEELMSAVRDGLGDRLVGVFDETTPEKSVETALDAADRMRESAVDALVPVGGGSSLDVAGVASALRADNRDLHAVRTEVAETGGLSMPADESALTPLFPVPTTLAGADLSSVYGISVPTSEGDVGTGVGGDALAPAAVCYDPALFETTPPDVLAGSAMNGFDKGLETVYSRRATPITDATAIRGLGLLADALPALHEAVESGDDPETVDDTVLGIVLVQYGATSASEMRLSVVHAFGHGLRKVAGVQQGVAHAVVVPHVLEHLFERVDGRRDALAEAFDVEDDEETAAGVVREVERVRDGLDLPSRLRYLDGLEHEDLPRVAELAHEDGLMAFRPDGYDPSVEDLEQVLESAW